MPLLNILLIVLPVAIIALVAIGYIASRRSDETQQKDQLPAHYSPLPGPPVQPSNKAIAPSNVSNRQSVIKKQYSPLQLTTLIGFSLVPLMLLPELAFFVVPDQLRPKMVGFVLTLLTLALYLFAWRISFFFYKTQWDDFPNPWHFWLMPTLFAFMLLCMVPTPSEYFPSMLPFLLLFPVFSPIYGFLASHKYHSERPPPPAPPIYPIEPPFAPTSEITEAARRIAEKYK
jgi:hypothetical protein